MVRAGFDNGADASMWRYGGGAAAGAVRMDDARSSRRRDTPFAGQDPRVAFTPPASSEVPLFLGDRGAAPAGVRDFILTTPADDGPEKPHPHDPARERRVHHHQTSRTPSSTRSGRLPGGRRVPHGKETMAGSMRSRWARDPLHATPAHALGRCTMSSYTKHGTGGCIGKDHFPGSPNRGGPLLPDLSLRLGPGGGVPGRSRRGGGLPNRAYFLATTFPT